MKKCTSCGAENSDDSKFCLMCSSPLQQNGGLTQNPAPVDTYNAGNQNINVATPTMPDSKPAVNENHTFKSIANFIGFITGLMLIRAIYSFTQIETFDVFKEFLLIAPAGNPLVGPMQTALNSFYASIAFTIISGLIGIIAIVLYTGFKKNYTVPGDAALKKRASVFFIVCAVLAAFTVIYFITQLTLFFSSLDMYRVMGEKAPSQDVITDIASFVFAVIMIVLAVMVLLKVRYLKKQL